MSGDWKRLQEALGRIDPEGEHGFEGLLASLFETETGNRFFVARKGDQPVGDAYSPTAGIALQAKRYTRASISENEVEGDIDRALREAPTLEVFVVAATRNLGQLAARLAHKTSEIGLEIVPLSLGNDLTELGALCVAHWDMVQKFLPDLGMDWQQWAIEQKAKPETRAALDRLKQDLLGLATRKWLSEKTYGQCVERFRGEGVGLRTHNRIQLGEAVVRTKLVKQLYDWWCDRKAPIAVLEGEEGTGKTWVAAGFCQSLFSGETPIVFWLDSLSWAPALTVEDLVSIALKGLLVPDRDLRERFQRKIFRLWHHPVLLVLDGANERDAWKAAERILQDYSAHNASFCIRIRLLFTSRPLESRTARDSWSGCAVLPVSAFDDEEFKTALKMAAPEISSSEFPAAVMGLATIPRYFRVCVRLREQLASVQHLSKELLLWADLRDKLANGDPQFRAIEEMLFGKPEEILAQLAMRVGWPEDNSPSVVTQELLQVFPNFLRARTDLMEQRIILNADFDYIGLSSDHVVLGWALALRNLAARYSSEGPEQLSQRLLRELEPAASNEHKVRALHVAALLSFMNEKGSRDSERFARAGLLDLWVSHHNAWVKGEALQFFVQCDLPAYTLAVESLFRGHLPGNLETTLIAPLARHWQEGKDAHRVLQQALERWLRLIYPGDVNGSKDRDEQPAEGLIAAATPEQLRLSYAAISVISFRPDLDLIPALIACHRSQDFCYVDYSAKELSRRYCIKGASDPLGVLLRWGYTESVITTIRDFASKRHPKGREDLQWFARLLRMTCLPEEVGLARDIYAGSPATPAQLVDEFRQFLRGPDNGVRRVLGLGGLERLAVRRDMPELQDEEVRALCAETQRRLTDNIAAALYPATWENREMKDLLPWLARYAPAEFESTYLALWKGAVNSKDPVSGLVGLDDLLPPADPEGHLVQTILERGASLVSQPNFTAVVGSLTATMLLHADLSHLMRWLTLIENKVFERGHGPLIGLCPLPDLFRIAAPQGLADLACQRFDLAFKGMTANPSQEEPKQLARHWLQIYSYLAPLTKEVGEWALQLADQVGTDSELRYPLFVLLSECSDPAVVLRAVAHPEFREYQVGLSAWRWAGHLFPEANPGLSLEKLRDTASLTVSGRLLANFGDKNEICKWGRALTRAALLALETHGPGWSPQSALEFHVDQESNLVRIGFKCPSDGGMTWHAISSPVWGIDRCVKRPSPEQEDYDAACDQFYVDMQKWRDSIRREFVGFNAAGPLFRWSELEPDVFAGFAEQFLDKLASKDVGAKLDFSFFGSCAAVGLLRVRPDRSLHFEESGKSNVAARINCARTAMSWEIAELWSDKLNAHHEVRKARRQLLWEASDDEALMWHAVAAHAGGNDAEVAEFATECLAAETARDRALGVTLLAFQDDAVSGGVLAQRKDSDPNFWIREHASWCVEVWATERACRQRYREVLKVRTLPELATGIAELAEAFSPITRAWRASMEKEASWPCDDRRMNAYLDSFWYHWNNTSSHKENVAICGRKLREHCRGERLKDGITSRQSPWWRLEKA
jgi:hypothetical protein